MDAPEKPKRNADWLARYRWKKGESGQGGRPTTTMKIRKRLTLALNELLEMEAPSEWFTNGIEKGAFQGLTIGEGIALRAAQCSLSNIPFRNAKLLELLWSRSEGKIPLKILHRDANQEDDGDYDIEVIDQRLANIIDVPMGKPLNLPPDAPVQSQPAETITKDLAQ